MANFNTHISVAAVVSMVAGSAFYVTKITPIAPTLVLIMLGTLGGILPDVDSETSTSVRLIFNLLGICISFFILFHCLRYYSILASLFFFLITFVLIRFVLLFIFDKFTVHRGVIHSVPMACIVALSVVLLAHYLFQFSFAYSWLAGGFISMGFLVHLVLDEIYSVNLAGARLKKSFGTALTFFSFERTFSYILLYLVLAGLVWLTPGFKVFSQQTFTTQHWQIVKNRFLPGNNYAARKE